MKDSKNVDVLKTGSINSPIGPTGTIRRLLINKDYLSNRGYELNVFTSEYFSNTKDNAVDIGNSNSLKSKFICSIKKLLKSRIPNSKILSILHIIRMILSAKKFVKKYQELNRDVEIIVFHDYFAFEQFEKVRRDKKQKTVLFFHNDGIKFELIYKTFPKLRNTLFSRLLENRFDEVINKLDKLVFISSNGRDNFVKSNSSIERDKISFFHNGIDDHCENIIYENVFSEVRKKFKYRICCVGSINKRKGQFKIVEALNQIESNVLSEICVTFIGKGSDYNLLKKLCEKYSLENHLFFEGIVENSKIHNFLKSCNIYILMSNNEGLPISIIEAMREGLPIISTDIAGIPEQVKDGYNGLLINPSVKELVKVFNNIDKYQWDEMGKKSRLKYEQEFTFDKMKREYCNMLDSI